LNLRPSGYEPDELPGCSTPRYRVFAVRQNTHRVLPLGKISYDVCVLDVRRAALSDPFVIGWAVSVCDEKIGGFASANRAVFAFAKP
jgi:hypothetical protein